MCPVARLWAPVFTEEGLERRVVDVLDLVLMYTGGLRACRRA